MSSSPRSRARQTARRKAAHPESAATNTESWLLEPDEGPLRLTGGRSWGAGLVGAKPFRGAIRLLGLGFLLERRRWKHRHDPPT